jgi:hypothetical protein
MMVGSRSKPLEEPFPKEIEDAIWRLWAYYGTGQFKGRKMVISKCKQCDWEAGFFFAGNYESDGLVRFDPGCYCKASVQTHESSSGYLALYISRYPRWVDKQVNDGQGLKEAQVLWEKELKYWQLLNGVPVRRKIKKQKPENNSPP